mmetsp:Transcript_13321/g.18158  ORF Transcript_13321/g.18158 Transcript_13321/m.18158 type:complete len:228 (+) Transcript_13321:1085-1768(+)
MLIHLTGIPNVDEGELGHADDREHENEKHEKQAERGHRWGGIQQRLKNFLQLLLLLDEAENATNSQRAQDCAENLQIFADASPSNAQNDDCADNNGEIEDIPAFPEVVDALCDELENGFDREDDHESVVEDLEHVLVTLRLHVPVETEHEGVAEDANHDEQVEVAMLCHDNHEVAKLAVSGLKALLWLDHGGEHVDASVAQLRTLQVTVALHDLLLRVKGLDDHTDE